MLDIIINALCDAEESWLWGTLHAPIGQINQRSDCVLLLDDDLDDIDSDNKDHQKGEEKGKHQVKVSFPFVWSEYFAIFRSV